MRRSWRVLWMNVHETLLSCNFLCSPHLHWRCLFSDLFLGRTFLRPYRNLCLRSLFFVAQLPASQCPTFISLSHPGPDSPHPTLVSSPSSNTWFRWTDILPAFLQSCACRVSIVMSS